MPKFALDNTSKPDFCKPSNTGPRLSNNDLKLKIIATIEKAILITVIHFCNLPYVLHSSFTFLNCFQSFTILYPFHANLHTSGTSNAINVPGNAAITTPGIATHTTAHIANCLNACQSACFHPPLSFPV